MNCGGFRYQHKLLGGATEGRGREGQWPGRAQAALVQAQGWAGGGRHTYAAGGAGGAG